MYIKLIFILAFYVERKRSKTFFALKANKRKLKNFRDFLYE